MSLWIRADWAVIERVTEKKQRDRCSHTNMEEMLLNHTMLKQ